MAYFKYIEVAKKEAAENKKKREAKQELFKLARDIGAVPKKKKGM